MALVNMKEQMHTLVDTLPETKLAFALDFLQFLVERETTTDLLLMQMRSDAYREWVGAENDIYDQVFADVQTG